VSYQRKPILWKILFTLLIFLIATRLFNGLYSTYSQEPITILAWYTRYIRVLLWSIALTWSVIFFKIPKYQIINKMILYTNGIIIYAMIFIFPQQYPWRFSIPLGLLTFLSLLLLSYRKNIFSWWLTIILILTHILILIPDYNKNVDFQDRHVSQNNQRVVTNIQTSLNELDSLSITHYRPSSNKLDTFPLLSLQQNSPFLLENGSVVSFNAEDDQNEPLLHLYLWDSTIITLTPQSSIRFIFAPEPGDTQTNRDILLSQGDVYRNTSRNFLQTFIIWGHGQNKIKITGAGQRQTKVSPETLWTVNTDFTLLYKDTSLYLTPWLYSFTGLYIQDIKTLPSHRDALNHYQQQFNDYINKQLLHPWIQTSITNNILKAKLALSSLINQRYQQQRYNYQALNCLLLNQQCLNISPYDSQRLKERNTNPPSAFNMWLKSSLTTTP